MRAASQVAALVITASAASAQVVSGTVRDSASRLPVVGVVVDLQDLAGGSITRTLTSSTGQFAIAADSRAARLKLVRIGFRARELRLAGDSLPTAPLEIALVRLPQMLEKMDVVAGAKCDQRTNAAGQALLQQARAGLLATIVGREVNPAKLVRLSYERTYGPRLDTMMPAVRIDSVNEARTTFRAARRGADLVRRGFTADSLGTGVYFGPDAEVLLDEGFEAGYCFYVTQRRGQIGLGFSPASSRRIGRVDVEGTLWIDPNERALRSLEYRYVGLGKEAEDGGVGGDLTYQEMPNGTVIVSRWSLRLLKVRVDSLMYRSSRLPTGRIVVSEGGGMVARAEWADGTKWEAPLGTLEVTAVDGESGRRVPGVEVRIRNTNQVGISDQSGVARFTEVLPGRYAVEVVNPELDLLGFIDPPVFLNAGRLDSAVIRASRVYADTSTEQLFRRVDVSAGRTTRHTAPMVTTKQFADRECPDLKGSSAPKRVILGRVIDETGAGADRALIVSNAVSSRIAATGRGGFVVCVPPDWVGPVTLVAGSPRGRSDTMTLELHPGVNTTRLVLRP